MRKHDNDSRINDQSKFIPVYDNRGNKIGLVPSWETIKFAAPLVQSFIDNLQVIKPYLKSTWPKIASGLFSERPTVALIASPEGQKFGKVFCTAYEIPKRCKPEDLSNFPKRDYAHFCFCEPCQKEAKKPHLKWKPLASWNWFFLGKNMWATEGHPIVRKTHRIMALAPDFKNASLEETIAWIMETEKAVTE